MQVIGASNRLKTRKQRQISPHILSSEGQQTGDLQHA
jgi:hypothetical protein